MAQQHGFLKFSEGDQLLPQAEMLDSNVKKSSLTIGIPVESSYQECRVPLVPQSAGLLVANGHRILIQKGAGKSAHFSDEEFSEAGAEIVYSSEEVYKADIILKVAPLTDKEIELLKSRQTIISAIHLPGQNRKYFEQLMARKMTAIAFEFIRDKSGSFPVRRSISEIVGVASLYIANEYLQNTEYGKGVLLGGFPGITPTEVVILGAGTVAESATRAALGIGAIVKVFDNSIYRLRRLQSNLNAHFFTSIMQPAVLEKALRTADVAIGAIHSPSGMTPCVVTEEMVSKMKLGSVIIDVSIDQGGCFETSHTTSHKNPVFKKHDVTHYCVPNIASKVPHTDSYAFSNFFTPILIQIGEAGGVEKMIHMDYGMRKGTYLFNGTLTKPYIGEYFTLPYQDIELLLAAFR